MYERGQGPDLRKYGNDSGVGRTSVDPMSRLLRSHQSRIEVVEQRQAVSKNRRRGDGGDSCSLTLTGSCDMGSSIGLPVGFSWTQIHSEGSGLTVTPSGGSGDVINIDLPGVYVASLSFVTQTSAAAALAVRVELSARTAFASTARWQPQTLPAGSFDLAGGLPLGYPYIAGDYIEVTGQIVTADGSATGDTDGAELHIFRLPGSAGGVAGV